MKTSREKANPKREGNTLKKYFHNIRIPTQVVYLKVTYKEPAMVFPTEEIDYQTGKAGVKAVAGTIAYKA